jgi:hypothetical protein
MDEIISQSGWLGEAEAAEQFGLIRDQYNFVEFDLIGATAPPEYSQNYRVPRKVLNRDIGGARSVQLIGDCVSWGMKHASEYLSCCDILVRNDAEEFHEIFSPYIYGISRYQIGGGRMGGDGSLGSWAAAGVMKYGVIFADKDNCPSYSKDVARLWGSKGPPSEFIPIGKKFLVKSAAKVTTWEKLIEGLANGYSCTVASNQGFSMKPDDKGFHQAEGSWAHQMCIYDYCLTPEPHALIANSWGDVHGGIKHFATGEDLPKGTIRAKKSTVEKMLGQGDSFLISQFDGFPSQDIPKALFKIVGN